jgi:hypothetical protein
MSERGPTPNLASRGDPPVQFRLSDARRIGHVVDIVEGSRRRRINSTLPRAAGGGGGGGGISTATFSGVWLKGSTKIINFSSASTATANCSNIIVDVLYSSTSRRCVVAKVGDDYTLVNVECG